MFLTLLVMMCRFRVPRDVVLRHLLPLVAADAWRDHSLWRLIL